MIQEQASFAPTRQAPAGPKHPQPGQAPHHAQRHKTTRNPCCMIQTPAPPASSACVLWTPNSQSAGVSPLPSTSSNLSIFGPTNASETPTTALYYSHTHAHTHGLCIHINTLMSSGRSSVQPLCPSRSTTSTVHTKQHDIDRRLLRLELSPSRSTPSRPFLTC